MNLPANANPRDLIESLGEEAVLDFLGIGSNRKPTVKFDPERKLVYLRYLIRSGRRGESALVAGVTYETMRRARVNDKEFALAEEAAYELHRDMVRALILEWAGEGADENTYESAMVYASRLHNVRPEDLPKEMVLTKRVRKKSEGMLLAYAKSIMPEFRDKGDIIANNASGGVLVVNQAARSSEEWEERHAASPPPAEDAEHEIIQNPGGDDESE